MAKLEVGQKLWFVPDDHRAARQAQYVTVVKVGRRWATLDSGNRVDVESLWVDGANGYPGICYVNKEAMEARRAWWEVKEKMRYMSTPDTVTTDAIYQAAALLGVEMPERASAGAPDKGGENA